MGSDDMERLTNSIDYCQLHCDLGKENACFFVDKTKCYEKNIYNKLRHYEDLAEQGRLIDIEWAERNEQIAEWLKELKAIKSDGFTDDLLNMGYTKGYRDAIDDFTERCMAEIIEYDCPLDMHDIAAITKQLRTGAK